MLGHGLNDDIRYLGRENRSPFNGKTLDFAHERELRALNDFNFDYSDIEFVTVASIEDAHLIASEFKGSIDSGRVIPIEVYETIEHLWPTRIL